MTTSLNKRSIRNHFNRQAGNYDRYARIQRDLANWMFDMFSSEEKSVRRILEIGCGTGYVTERLVSMFPKAGIVAVDLAPAMLEIAAARIDETDRVFFLEHDVEQPLPDSISDFLGVSPIGAFDLIITSGTLQWLDRPEETLRLLSQALHRRGRFHGGIFGAETFRELREAFAAASQGQGHWSHGPPLRTHLEWASLCEKAGLTPTQVHTRSVKDNYSSVQQFLKGIQKSGANNAASSENVCRRPSVVRTMMEVYRDRFATTDGVYATWEFVCITAGHASNDWNPSKIGAVAARTH